MISTTVVPRICFVGIGNLPLLAPEYAQLRAGGAELQQTLLARALARRGWPVSMVVADCGQSDGAAWDGVRTYKAYRPDEGIPGIRFVHPRWTKLLAALGRADADIYYTSCAGALLAQVVLFAHARGRRVAFRIASDSDCDPRGLLIRFWRDRQLYRYGLGRADIVLAQTPEQQLALRRNFRVQSLLAPPLADPAAPRRSFEERDMEALWVGNLRALKRPGLLLQVARRLPAVRFNMVGGPMPGAEPLFETIRAQAAQLANVTFHGPVPYRRTREFFERARVFVATSETEGFPNAYLQSWAHGTPVVAFLDPGQLLERHGMGRAVSGIEQMCAAVSELSRDPARWQAASERACRYMDGRLDESRMLAPYIEGLTGRHPAPAAVTV